MNTFAQVVDLLHRTEDANGIRLAWTVQDNVLRVESPLGARVVNVILDGSGLVRVRWFTVGGGKRRVAAEATFNGMPAAMVHAAVEMGLGL